jgi:hypothetical protein
MPATRKKKAPPRKTDLGLVLGSGKNDRYVYSGFPFADTVSSVVRADQSKKGKIVKTVFMPEWTDLPGGGGILEFDSLCKPAPRPHSAGRRSRRGRKKRAA